MGGVSSNPTVIFLFLLITSATLGHIDAIIFDKMGIVSVFTFLVIVAHHLTPCALSKGIFAFFVVSESFLR